MTDDFASIFTSSDYRVRLARGGYATIRVGLPLPIPLLALSHHRPWGFITAWNPQGLQRDRPTNRLAQRQLVKDLKASPATEAILPAFGIGSGWHEPSLWVIGPDVAELDALARRYEQLAWMHGDRGGIARLRWP